MTPQTISRCIQFIITPTKRRPTVFLIDQVFVSGLGYYEFTKKQIFFLGPTGDRRVDFWSSETSKR